jgi:5-methyltetrahydrofolate--homocysteine methyltransferase
MAPVYNGPVAKATTAIDTVNLVNRLSDHQACLSLYEEQEAIRRQKTENLSLEDYNSIEIEAQNYAPYVPVKEGVFTINPMIEEVLPFIDWAYFFFSLQFYGKYPDLLDNNAEAQQAFEHAHEMLAKIIADKSLSIEARFGVVKANNMGDDLIRLSDGSKSVELPMLRRQTKMQDSMSIADTVGCNDYLGVFALTAGIGLSKLMSEAETPYDALVVKLLADRLTEATGEYIHYRIRSEYWGFDKSPFSFDEKQYQGRRMCFGYPACPDHSMKKRVFDFLEVEQHTSMRLTDSYMITPEESLCGLITSRGGYFSVGRVDEAQLEHYSKYAGLSVEKLKEILPNNI